MPASRTTKTLRPAELTQILPTGLLVGETRLDLGQIPRIIFHFPRSYILWSPESSEYPSSTITTGDTFLESYVMSSLSPGSISNSVDIIVPAVSAGNYFIGAIVDSNGDVVEDIETNNTASTPMEVVTGGGGRVA